MAIPHAASGQVIDIRPLGAGLKDAITTTLARTDQLEVIRLVLPAGKTIEEHRAPGEITVQCLEGTVEFQAHGQWRTLQAAQMLRLDSREPHALKAVEDSTVLVTILLRDA